MSVLTVPVLSHCFSFGFTEQLKLKDGISVPYEPEEVIRSIFDDI